MVQSPAAADAGFATADTSGALTGCDLFSKLASIFEPANMRKAMDTLAGDSLEQITDKPADVIVMLHTAFKDVDSVDKESFLSLAAG